MAPVHCRAHESRKDSDWIALTEKNARAPAPAATSEEAAERAAAELLREEEDELAAARAKKQARNRKKKKKRQSTPTAWPTKRRTTRAARVRRIETGGTAARKGSTRFSTTPWPRLPAGEMTARQAEVERLKAILKQQRLEIPLTCAR